MLPPLRCLRRWEGARAFHSSAGLEDGQGSLSSTSEALSVLLMKAAVMHLLKADGCDLDLMAAVVDGGNRPRSHDNMQQHGEYVDVFESLMSTEVPRCPISKIAIYLSISAIHNNRTSIFRNARMFLNRQRKNRQDTRGYAHPPLVNISLCCPHS